MCGQESGERAIGGPSLVVAPEIPQEWRRQDEVSNRKAD